MLFSEAKNRKVVNTADATTLGKIRGFVIDPKKAAVIALICKKTDDGDTLRWTDLTAFGSDAVTVDSKDRLKAADEQITELSDKKYRIDKKLVLTAEGDALGDVKDVEFDPETGALVSLKLDNGNSTATKMVGLGSYAVVVVSPSAE